MENNELTHYGVKGQKWYIRRYQNKDGSLTSLGKKRQAKEEEAAKKKAEQEEAARKQEHDYSIADRLYEEHARPTIRACNRAYENYKAGKKEEAMKDLDEAGAHLKKIEEGVKKAYEPERILKSDLYLEPKWLYESILEDEFGQRSEFIEEQTRRVKHSDIDDSDDCLYHHGVKGQKWYIRRYQNRDGTLTPAGKKRYAKDMEKLKKEEQILKNKQRTKAQLDKLEEKRKSIEEQKKALDGKKTDEKKTEREKPAANVHDAIGKKKIKDMTDEELKALTDRMQLEKNYKDALAALTPKAEKGKTFSETLKDEVIGPGLKAAGKDVTTKTAKWVADQVGKAIKESIEESKKEKK